MNEKKTNISRLLSSTKRHGEKRLGNRNASGGCARKIFVKKLFLKAGYKGGLQYHHKKNECGYLISGKLIIRFDDGNGKIVERMVEPGESFHFPPGAVHQEEAITDCVIIEASTPYFNDRVRVEELYGLKIEGGLPSTKINEVQKL